MCAFDRLQNLGTDKFQTIVTKLLQRVPALIIARMIQEEWAVLRDVPEPRLANKLRRLHGALLRGAFPKNVREARNTIDDQSGIPGLQCLREMFEVADLHLAAILRAEYQGAVVPVAVLRGYKETISTILQMKFDLGLIEYRRGQLIAALREEDAKKQKDEAYARADEVLSQAGIDDLSPEEIDDGNAY